jgi:hypothetical protein
MIVREISAFNMCVFQVAGLESDCMFKANERMVLKIYLTTLGVDDLSDMTLYSKVRYNSVTCCCKFRHIL